MNSEILKSQSDHRRPTMTEDRRILAEMMAALDEHQGSVPDGLYLTLCNHLRDLHRGRRVVTRVVRTVRVPERPARPARPQRVEGYRWLTDEEWEAGRFDTGSMSPADRPSSPRL